MGRGNGEQRPYPTDANGLAYHPKELGLFDFTTPEAKNNHHLNFYARSFGALAISQTFRDLEQQQVMMPITEHVKLHRLFSGIALPRPIVMMTEIERSRESDSRLKIYRPGDGYAFSRISAELWGTLTKEYNEVGNG